MCRISMYVLMYISVYVCMNVCYVYICKYECMHRYFFYVCYVSSMHLDMKSVSVFSCWCHFLLKSWVAIQSDMFLCRQFRMWIKLICFSSSTSCMWRGKSGFHGQDLQIKGLQSSIVDGHSILSSVWNSLSARQKVSMTVLFRITNSTALCVYNCVH